MVALVKNSNRQKMLRSLGLAVCLSFAGLAGHASIQQNISDTQATFTWAAATGLPDAYEVFVNRSTAENSFELEQIVTAGPMPEVTLTAAVGEVLRVRVRARRGGEVGPFSVPSIQIRLGLPDEVPKIGTPGTFFGRVAGADTEDIISLDDASGSV